MKQHPSIGVYNDHKWCFTVQFKRRWQATLFHMLLNSSLTEQAGTRDS